MVNIFPPRGLPPFRGEAVCAPSDPERYADGSVISVCATTQIAPHQQGVTLGLIFQTPKLPRQSKVTIGKTRNYVQIIRTKTSK